MEASPQPTFFPPSLPCPGSTPLTPKALFTSPYPPQEMPFGHCSGLKCTKLWHHVPPGKQTEKRSLGRPWKQAWPFEQGIPEPWYPELGLWSTGSSEHDPLAPWTSHGEECSRREPESGPLKGRVGNSLAVQWIGLRAFTAKGLSSIPGWGTKIPQAAQRSKKKRAGSRAGSLLAQV